MAENLVNHLDEIAAQLRAAPRVLLFSDFDGTLTPIKDRPDDCFLDSEVRSVLQGLADSEQFAVGVVSGRDLADLRPRVGIDGIAYAGNHGLEIEGRGFSFLEPTAVSRRSELDKLLSDISPALEGISGVWIQHKGLSASVHYRQADPAAVPQLLESIQRIVAPFVDANRFILRSGKMVLEIRPAVNWHKGKAVEWLANQMALGNEKSTTIYLGDDNTDEDAFHELLDGITIAVGDMRITAAKYSLPNSSAVHAFLNWLLTTIVN